MQDGLLCIPGCDGNNGVFLDIRVMIKMSRGNETPVAYAPGLPDLFKEH
jgi:hypothetical protein